MTWGVRNRRIIAVFVSIGLSVGIGACGSSARPDGRWVGAGASGTPSDGASAPVDGDDEGPGANGDASPSPGKSGTGSTTTAPPANGDYLARVPTFGARPPAKRVQLPGGAGAAWMTHVPTDQPVAFLTIDDGWIKRPEALPLFQRAKVPVTLFLTINAIKDNPGYFQQLRGAGGVIEAHTLTHNNLKGKSYDVQKHEICGSADQLGQLYGRRPVLFRPPFGEKDDTTLKVVHDCGMKAAFFWKETVDKGIVRYQSGHSIQAGDIILMHFRDRFVDDFIAALQAIKDSGLTPALLEDYIPT